MTRAARLGAYVAVALVLVAGAAFPFWADAVRPGPVAGNWPTALRSAGWAAGPTGALLWVVRWAGSRPVALGAALVGSLLVLGLGLALYAAALRPDARPFAPAVALTFVPLRQLAAAAFVGWAVWLARRAR